MNIIEAAKCEKTKKGKIVLCSKYVDCDIWNVYEPQEKSDLYNLKDKIASLILYPYGLNRDNYNEVLKEFLENN